MLKKKEKIVDLLHLFLYFCKSECSFWSNWNQKAAFCNKTALYPYYNVYEI